MHQYRIASVIDRLMIEMIAAMQMRKKFRFFVMMLIAVLIPLIRYCMYNIHVLRRILLKVHRNIM